MNRSSAAGSVPNQSKSSPSPSHVRKPTSGSCQVRSNHPWMAIVHSGPWTQLPPTKPPVTPPGTWYRPRVAPPNPFDEVEEEDIKADEVADGAKTEATNPSTPSKETNQSDNDASNPKESVDAHSLINLTELIIEPNIVCSGSRPEVPESGATSALDVHDTAGDPNVTDVRDLSKTGGSDALSGAISGAESGAESGLAAETHVDSDLTTAANSALTLRPAPAPGYGFPLIKRKVQTDPDVPSQNLDAEREELEKQLEVLAQRGLELEINLRCCDNDKEEEKMLMDWLAIVHEKHVLACKDAELVFLIRQRDLEERQADIEYQLRCLLNKPDKEWSQEDRVHEQQLMDKMVAVIEQRNQIISSLDQDRQREKAEDKMLEVIMNSKDLQKEGLKDLKKTKGKLKPMTVLSKMLSNKLDFVDKKS